MDPSALFTVIFDPDFTDFSETDVRQLNYTYYGSETMELLSGAWVDASLYFSKDPDDTTVDPFEVDLTIFVVNSTAVDAGLDGTLGIAMVPNFGDWQQVSVMDYLFRNYEHPINYMSFTSEKIESV